MFGDIPHEVGARSQTAVVMAKRNTEAVSRLARIRESLNLSSLRRRLGLD